MDIQSSAKRIESADLRVDIDPHGSQIDSIFLKSAQLECIWQKDPAVWKSSCPVPFPTIGRLNKGTTYFDGKPYTIKSNGIIRYVDLKVINHTSSSVDLLFESTPETKKEFPFDCHVELHFEVEGTKLLERARIYNDDTKPMPYNFATHPGLNVPLLAGESANDYYIEFDEPQTVSRYVVAETAQLTDELVPFLDHERRFFIQKSLFERETLCLKNPTCAHMELKSLTNPYVIRMSLDGFDHVAFWSPAQVQKDMRLLCVESWVGHPDFKGNESEFIDRDSVAILGSGEHKTYSYTLEVASTH